MIIVDCEQGTESWFQARLGIPTASNFNKIVTSKGEPSKQAQKYIYQLAGEAIIGKQEDSFQSLDMIRGNELEAEARDFYRVVTDSEVKEVGFCVTDDRTCGASPDSLVGEKGLLEIKCPKLSTHIGYLIENKLPTDYVQQCQGQLYVTGRDWLEFVSYYPSIKPLIVRVKRDNAFLKKLKVELDKFTIELNILIKQLKEKK